jgi:hypothetical protein
MVLRKHLAPFALTLSLSKGRRDLKKKQGILQQAQEIQCLFVRTHREPSGYTCVSLKRLAAALCANQVKEFAML